MNDELKLLALRIIKENDGFCDWNTLQAKVKAQYHIKKISSIPSDKQITHSLYLFEKDDAVERVVDSTSLISYRLTPWGYLLLDAWYKKWAYFLIYKKNNLISLVALIISIFALILSKQVWNLLSKIF